MTNYWNHLANAITFPHTRLTALCPGLPGWAGTRKVKPIWIFTEARDSEWQSHQLGHMQVCTVLQTDNHASTPPQSFYRPDALPATQPTASKNWRPKAMLLHLSNAIIVLKIVFTSHHKFVNNQLISLILYVNVITFAFNNLLTMSVICTEIIHHLNNPTLIFNHKDQSIMTKVTWLHFDQITEHIKAGHMTTNTTAAVKFHSLILTVILLDQHWKPL